MRRPTPLPPSEPGRSRPPRRSEPEVGGAAEPGATASIPRDDVFSGVPVATPDAVTTGAVTTPIDLLPRIEEREGGQQASGESAEPASVTEPQPASEAGGNEEGFGQVWRAARARRKALASEVRRFTVRQRRRRMLWLASIGAVLVVGLGAVAAAYSPLFAVEQITVTGTQQLDAAAVTDALASQLGTPLPLVDDSAVKAALVAFPLIETYALEARPPHELVVRIVERTPIGVIESPAGFTVVDAAGVALSTTQTPEAGRPLLVVSGGVSSDAFAAAARVLRSLPAEIMAQVTEVAATGPNDVTLTLGPTGTKVVWGSSDDSAMKALLLSTTMRARAPDTVSSYDVSSTEAVVVQ